MIKTGLFFLFVVSLFYSCSSQKDSKFRTEKNNSERSTFCDKTEAGILFFSSDNGENWVDAGSGLPQTDKIGLDGIAVSNQKLGLATKQSGVYEYNFKTNFWENIPTEKQIIEANPGALAFLENDVFVGTQFAGVFYTNNLGKSWTNCNSGLTNLTIRRFFEFNQQLYVCTNDGFYCFNEASENWQLEFGQRFLQVNGATSFDGSFYLATNQGIYRQQTDKTWINMTPDLSVHHISSDKNRIYAMSYNELLVSSNYGLDWESQQNGLPENLYTFNVLNHHEILFAGQWDGVYRKTKHDKKWMKSNNGLPSNLAVLNLKAFHHILVVSISE